MDQTELLARIDRLESLDEIRQLPARYALSLDMRDLDAHVNLFAPDIRVSRDKVGRSHGVVYSKNEHETPCADGGREWVIMQMLYWDNYERIEGRWYFRRRLPCYWYATDINKPPVGDNKMRWPDREPYAGAYHDLWPSWQSFWDNPPDSDEPEVAAPAPLDQFLNTMRGDAGEPKIRVR